MNPPRFKAVSVEGFAGVHGSYTTVWYVLDRVYCHRIVRDYKGKRGTPEQRRRLAVEAAAELNRKHA